MNSSPLLRFGVVSTAAFGLFVFLLWLFGIGPSDLVMIATAIGTVLGTYYMDRYFTHDDIGQKIANPRVLLMMRMALALSAASFITSLFGMIDFVMGSVTGVGGYVVNWIIALAVTFAIQGMLLATSLELGHALQRLRRLPFEDYVETPRDRLEELRIDKAKGLSGSRKKRSRLAMIFIFGSLAVAFLLYTGFSLVDLMEAGARLWSPDGEGFSPWLIAALVFLPLPLSIAFGLLHMPRGFFALVMLSIAFLFFLFFSSVFSYDNYYRILQSDEDEEQRRGSIIRESIPSFLVQARQSLEAERFGLMDTGSNAEFIDDMLSDLDRFVAVYRANLDRLAQDEVAMRERRSTRKQEIQAEIDALREQERQELAATSSMLGDAPAAEAKVDLLTEELAQLNEERDRIEGEIAQIRADIAENERLARCEEFGNANPEDNCANTTGIIGCDTACEGYKAKAKDLLERVLPTPQGELARNRQDIASKERELRDAQIELQSIIDQSQPVDGGESPVVVARREIRDRYARAIKALQDEWDTLTTIERRGGSFSADALSTALAEFRARPGEETAQAFTDQCTAARLDLINAGVTDSSVTAYDCAPAQLAAIAKTAQSLDAALAAYEQRCTVERVVGYDITDPTATPVVLPDEAEGAAPADPAAEPATAPAIDPAAPSASEPAGETDPATTPAEPPAGAGVAAPDPAAALAAQNDIPVLREIVNRARACLSSANVGQDGVAALQVELTELESVYLLSSTDMRASIQDLLRLNFFAVGAAILAVGGDLLVLFTGAWAAYRSDSPILRDSLSPDIARVEHMLKRAAAHHPPEYSAAVGMQRFLAYLAEARLNKDEDQFFRSTVDIARVSDADKRLVSDILRAIPSSMLRDVDFVPIGAPPGTAIEKRRAIYQPVVEFMTGIAHSEPNAMAGKAAVGEEAYAASAANDLKRFIYEAARSGRDDAPGGSASPARPAYKSPEAES